MRHAAVRWLALTVALTAAAASTARAQVRLALDGEGRLAVRGLPAILDEEDVVRHLRSGLTTSLVLRVGGPQPAGARIDVRYELWEEEFLVTVADGVGGIDRARHPSTESFASWWAELVLPVSAPAPTRALPASTRVELDLIPFSQGEQVDAQRWLAESIGRGSEGSRPGVEGPVARVVGALIATSIQRRSVRSWSWIVEIGEGSGPP